ncbi:GNAT family N-acetyltransferase [Halobacillus salinus]|uniref:GNAT family N-acetyltransferase n=1 Tax=Halobacillus salinus TaxID=192814 RepID=UPI0009A6C465|nr:GNAT family N-acetyltransferase [Halobacillus salinus]
MSLYLEALTSHDGEKIYEMLQEIDANDNGFKNEVKGMSYNHFLNWLQKNEGYSHGLNLNEGMVPQTTFWLFHDGIPVGYGRIRHFLNENLRKNSGHLGYAISSSHRGKGYGSTLLGLLIYQCIELGIDPIQVGVNNSNEPSNALVRRHGGVIHSRTENKNIYKIEKNRFLLLESKRGDKH